jgi:ABC-2 type transport system permease protein
MSRPRALVRAFGDELQFLFGPGRATLLVMLGLPIFYPVVMSWLYAGNVAIERPTLVVDEDRSALSRQIQFRLDATQEIRVIGNPSTVDEGLDAVRRGDAEMLLWIPQDFTRTVQRGKTGRLPVWVDSANMVTYAGGMPGLTNVVGSLNEELGARFFMDKGMTTALADARVMPVLRDDHVRFRPTMGYGDFLISGVFAVVVQQIVLIGMTVSFGMSAEFGRRRGRGRHALSDLFGRALAHVPFYLLGSAVLVFVMFPLAGWTLVRPLALFGLFTLLVLSLLPMAATCARLASDRFDAFLLLMFLSTPMFMASGYAWPTDRMPGWVQAVAACFPLTPALQGMRTVATATGDLGSVVPQILHLGMLFVGWSLVLMVSVAVSRWLEHRRTTGPEITPA